MSVSERLHSVFPDEPQTASGSGRYRCRIGTVSNGQFLVAFAVAAAAGTAVFFHATRNQVKHPSVWASFVFLFLIVGLPLYLVQARRVRRRRQ